MIPIDEAYVDAAAPNADAAKNGRGLVLKNKFTNAARLRRRDDPVRRVPGQRQGAVPGARATSPGRTSRPTAAPARAGSSRASTAWA